MTHRQLVALIQQRMDALGMTPYRLHAELKGEVSKQTVYNFLQHKRALRSDSLLQIMNFLGLTVVEKSDANSNTHASQRSKKP